MDKDLEYFRTLHSFCFHLSDIDKNELMGAEHLHELSKRVGFNLTGKEYAEEDDIGANSKDNPIMQVIQLSRLKKEPIDKTYSESTIDEPFSVIQYIDKAYREFKTANRLYDYTDILEWFAEHGSRVCPNYAVTFLDEAQDLSPLQWEIAHILNKSSQRMYVAGDDDQAIYRWAGADVEHFLDVEDGSEVLSQSYRIPKSVHQYATRIVNRIKTAGQRPTSPSRGRAG